MRLDVEQKFGTCMGMWITLTRFTNDTVLVMRESIIRTLMIEAVIGMTSRLLREATSFLSVSQVITTTACVSQVKAMIGR